MGCFAAAVRGQKRSLGRQAIFTVDVKKKRESSCGVGETSTVKGKRGEGKGRRTTKEQEQKTVQRPAGRAF